MESLPGKPGIEPTFWRGRRVFVTGHTGFKGSWLCLWLERLNALTTGFALDPPTRPSLFEEAGVADGIVDIRGDVRDLESLSKSMTRSEPEVVIHMAAQPLVRRAYAAPLETFSTNVLGTANVLEVVRRCKTVRSVVIVTTDKCYRNQGWRRGYREDDPLGGHDPYSASKGCAEIVTSSYRHSFFDASSVTRHDAAVASARAGNVIGGGDWAGDRLVPDMIRAFAEGRPVSIRNPSAVRPWQHVLEPLSGYLLLAERLASSPEFADGWNFGPDDDDARPVSWVVDRLASLWGDGACWRNDGAVHPHEDHLLRLDCSRARSRLNWSPRLSLGDALEWTVEWYRAYGEGEDIRRVTLEQIARYERLGEARTNEPRMAPADLTTLAS